jgi:hypothetical protein
MHDELIRIWKETAVAECKVLFRNLPGGTEKHHETSQDSWSPVRGLPNTEQKCQPLSHNVRSQPLLYLNFSHYVTTGFLYYDSLTVCG